MDMNESLLRAILATIGRQTFPPDELTRLIAPTVGGEKQLQAYNLCDGNTPQAKIGKAASLDKGNLSRSIARWIELGIVVRVGSDQLPLHIYPLPKEYFKNQKSRTKK